MSVDALLRVILCECSKLSAPYEWLDTVFRAELVVSVEDGGLEEGRIGIECYVHFLPNNATEE